MKRRLECIISGKVQAVMFRDFSQRQARKFHIFGTAQNCSDGTVKIVGEGEEENLRKFLQKLKKGPLFARVKSVQEMWADTSGVFSDFSILYKDLLDRL
jgi:acylphosphatase